MTTCSESSERDDTLPIDRVEVKDSVMFYLDGVLSSDLSETTLNLIIEKCVGKFVDNQTYTCDVIYCSLLESLKYLIRKSYVQDGGDSVGTLTKRREKDGTTEIEVGYSSTSGQSSENGWEKLYEYFLENPSDICECLQPTYSSTFGLVSIGGTRKDVYDAIENGENNKGMWDRKSIGTKFSSHREYNRREDLNRSKYWRK
jgi:hypothetical protein